MTADKENKINEIMTEIYVDLYKKSTPSADFKKLLEEAELNEQGQKIIPFDEYEIELDVFEEILNKHVDTSKFTKCVKRKIKQGIYLGCSPKYKKNENRKI